MMRAAETAPVAGMERNHSVMPVPAELHFKAGRMVVTPGLGIAVHGYSDARLESGIVRALRRWEERTGLTFVHDQATPTPTNPPAAGIIIECGGSGQAIPSLDEDESYTLDISATEATLRAPTVVGALRGLETLLQLLAADSTSWYLPAVSIRDQPRFHWRGLLIDVCRHWQPMEVIKRTLDGMAVVKLNVLHLHLSDYQGFRIESKRYPKLHGLGSDGLYFTQDQIREIVAYATARGIRVLPEFDMPGHGTSWLVGYPELASGPGPFTLARRWGVFDPVFDPTNEDVYKFLDVFFGEMAALFPDAFVHIGGDENNGKQWSANPRIQAFIAEHHLQNNAGLQAYFNRRVGVILAKHGKRLVGWDEILHPDLPTSSVVQSWRGTAALSDAARRGFTAILSNGYYLDHYLSAARHYANDPLPANTTLTAEEQRRVLGGEACMWSEWVTPENIDSRIWPRTAAIAERLWSPREVNDVTDMYRRLAVVSSRLEEAGTLHEKNPEAMLRRYAGDHMSEAEFQKLRVFASVMEGGSRPQSGVTFFTPLTQFTFCAKPESTAMRQFGELVQRFLFTSGPRDPALTGALGQQLETWRKLGDDVANVLGPQSPLLSELVPVSRAFSEASTIGREALHALAAGHAPAETWARTQSDALTQLKQTNVAHVRLALLPWVRLLVAAVVAEPQRATLPAAEWQALVEKLATPEPPAKKTP